MFEILAWNWISKDSANASFDIHRRTLTLVITIDREAIKRATSELKNFNILHNYIWPFFDSLWRGDESILIRWVTRRCQKEKIEFFSIVIHADFPQITQMKLLSDVSLPPRTSLSTAAVVLHKFFSVN